MPAQMKPQAILCDRDGALIEDVHYLSDPAQLQWIPGVLELLGRLHRQGVKVLVVSNQSGVARGYFDRAAVEAVHARLQRDVQLSGGQVAAFYYCPHHPQGSVPQYSYACDCRKPAAGMFLRAIQEHHLQPDQCWVVGDRLRDLEPGLGLGMKPFLVKTGYGIKEIPRLQTKPYAHQVTVLPSLSALGDCLAAPV